MSALLAAITCLLIAASPTRAEERRLVVDPEASEVTFTLGATLHTVRGSFRLERGELRFDARTGLASGEVVVDAGSGVTGIGARDRRMHEEVLESGRHPRIAFRLEGVELGDAAEGGAVRIVARGRLAIHGGEHELRVPLRVTLLGAGAPGERLRVEGGFEVPFVAWGMRDPSRFPLSVDDRVAVRVALTGTLRGAAGADSAPPGRSRYARPR